VLPARTQALGGALLLVAFAGTASGAEPDVLDYQLELQVDPADRHVRGSERIRLRSLGGVLDTVIFPRNGIDVVPDSVRIDRGAARHWLTADTIEIPLRRPLAPGATAVIELAYVARSPRGMKFTPKQVHSAFFTCHWMVCREDPGDRATLTMTIEAPEHTVVVASGTPGTPEMRAGRFRQTWRERRPYPSYLFGFALGPFTRTVRRHRDTRLETYAVALDAATRERMFADTGPMLDFFASKAGLPLPHTHYRQVVVDGDEAQEATSFSMLGRTHLDPLLDTPREDWVIAHELAHQFWGNLVTCADWRHFWLNEGLTVFMVAAWKERRWGRPAYERELELARNRHAAAVAEGFDVPLTFAGRYPSLRVRRAIAYSKGALFVATLREAMGERAFWSALRRYTRRYAGRSVTSADFQRVFESESSRDLGSLFAAWVK
jgi:aminopeptidase N